LVLQWLLGTSYYLIFAMLVIYLSSLVARTLYLVPFFFLPSAGRPRLTVNASLAAWRQREMRWTSVSFKTQDDVVLSGAQWLHPKWEKVGPEEQRWLVYCQGSSALWEENMQYVACLAHAADCNALVFNYRGVGASGGVPRTGHDLMNDTCAPLDWLFKHGASPRFIHVHGRGLGASTAAQAVVELRNQVSGITCSHAFSSLAQQAATYCEIQLAWNDRTNKPKSTKSSDAVFYLSFLITAGVRSLGWHMDTVAAVRAWHEAEGNMLMVYHPQDGVICSKKVYDKKLPNKGAQLREGLEGYRNRSKGSFKVHRCSANWEGKQAHQYPNVGGSDFHSVAHRVKIWMEKPCET